MKGQVIYAPEGGRIEDAQLREILEDSLSDCRDSLKKVLLLIPDYTRYHSNAGKIANTLYHLLKDSFVRLHFEQIIGNVVPLFPFIFAGVGLQIIEHLHLDSATFH